MTQSAPADAVEAVLTEHADLERQLSDPELHGDAANARRVGRRFAQIAPIVATHRKLEAARGDLEAARELAADDASFAAEVPELEALVEDLDNQLTDMLALRDPHDADDIVLEVKSGEGGEESALFAADLARMYIRYAERHGWTVNVLDETFSDLGGYKEATIAIASKGDAVDGVWSRLAGGWCTGSSGYRSPSRKAGCTPLRRVSWSTRARRSRAGSDRRIRLADRRLPIVGQGWPRREHHRLGGADHPSAHRDRRHLPERALTVAEQGPRHAGAGCPIAGSGRRAGPSRRLGGPREPDPHRGPQ